MHAHLGSLWPAGDHVPVGILFPGPELGVEHRGNGEHGREQPDEGNVEGVGPGSSHVLGEVPLAVLREQVEGEEERSEREEKQETVVEISKQETVVEILIKKVKI